jgi:monomeric sarcosine oxidase
MKTDVCILGGGIMGLATAYNICKSTNSKVLVLDRYGVGNDFCSSNDVNRVFRCSYGSDELYTKMTVSSLDLWTMLERKSGQKLLIPTGLILLQGQNSNSNGFNEASFKTLSRMGLGADRLDKEELESRFPQFRAPEGFFDHHGGLLLASKALHTFHSLAESHGVRFAKATARKVVSSDRPHVTTEEGQTIEFRKLVVTTGPWTNSLLEDRLARITPTRQQLVYFRPLNRLDLFRPEKCPVFFTDEHYGLPAGGIDAVKVSPKELSEAVDPDRANRSVDDEQISSCREACKRFVPALADGEVVRTKVCLYDMTENSDFVIDRDPEDSKIVYGYGFSGHGFKFAPLIGQLLAQLTLDEDPSFNLERFTAKRSKRRKPVLGAHLGKGE